MRPTVDIETWFKLNNSSIKGQKQINPSGRQMRRLESTIMIPGPCSGLWKCHISVVTTVTTHTKTWPILRRCLWWDQLKLGSMGWILGSSSYKSLTRLVTEDLLKFCHQILYNQSQNWLSRCRLRGIIWYTIPSENVGKRGDVSLIFLIQSRLTWRNSLAGMHA